MIGNDTAITVGGMGGHFELNVYIPLMARNLLDSIELLSNASRLLAEKCVDGIEANRERNEQYAESTLSAATALNPFIGYDKAAEIVKEASASGRPLREVAREAGVDEAILDQALDYHAHGEAARLSGRASRFFDAELRCAIYSDWQSSRKGEFDEAICTRPAYGGRTRVRCGTRGSNPRWAAGRHQSSVRRNGHSTSSSCAREAAVSPTKFITAAHCSETGPGTPVAVFFGPDGFDDPAGFVTGTWWPHPGWCLGMCARTCRV